MNTSNETGIAKAVRLAKSQTAIADLFGLKPQAVQKWVAKGYAPGDRCRRIEEFLNGEVTRYELNPQVFGPAPINKTRRSTDHKEAV
jgi:DNA-binding transcriptional regulator YdaS (Cro superfamily)